MYAGRDVDSRLVIKFLKSLNEELRADWCLLWDRLNAHRAKITTAYLQTVPQIHAFFLPAYAPELNCVEYVWCYCKMNPLANVAVYEVAELAAKARRSGRSLQRKPELLRSFIRHSPLFLRLK